MKNETVLTPGQMKELASALLEALPVDIDADVAQGWIENKKALAKGLRELLVPPIADTDILADWKKFYSDEFGIELDTASIRVPEKRKGFDRPIVVAAGLKTQQVYDKCKSLFPCWIYTDQNLDKMVPTNDRDSQNGSYAVWIRNRVEADEELKNLSSRDLKQKSISGITLLERLLFELKYFRETGKHLDVRNWTLCAGSRDSDGSVPRVNWNDDKLFVRWYYPVHTFGDLRSREVVS